MKRRGFFKAVLALVGLGALGQRLFPTRTQFMSVRSLVYHHIYLPKWGNDPNSLRFIVNDKTGVYEVWREPMTGKVTLTENPDWVSCDCSDDVAGEPLKP